MLHVLSITGRILQRGSFFNPCKKTVPSIWCPPWSVTTPASVNIRGLCNSHGWQKTTFVEWPSPRIQHRLLSTWTAENYRNHLLIHTSRFHHYIFLMLSHGDVLQRAVGDISSNQHLEIRQRSVNYQIMIFVIWHTFKITFQTFYQSMFLLNILYEQHKLSCFGIISTYYYRSNTTDINIIQIYAIYFKK